MESVRGVSRGAVVQSDWRVTTGWRTEGSEFEFLKGQVFSILYSIQTGSDAHPVSYQMGTGASFRGGKAAGA
jgi:hypothetical protein